MKVLKSILKYSSYLSPILIKKYSYNFKAKHFIHSLRMNTLLPYSDKIQENRDRKIGRRLSGNYLYMSEYDNLLFLKNSINNRHGSSKTLIWITNRSQLTFYKISYPSFFLLFLFLSLSSIYCLINFDLNYFSLLICLLILIGLAFQSEIKDHNILINNVLDYCKSEQETKTASN